MLEPKLVVDMDGVMANFTKSFIRIINQLYPKTLQEHQTPKTWGWEDLVPKKVFDAAWNHLNKVENFWMTLEPIRKNTEALQKFLRNHPAVEVTFMTSRGTTAGWSPNYQTEGWLRLNGFGDFKNIFVAVVKHPSDKVKEIQFNQTTHMIDDKLETILECQKYTKAALLNYPYNDHKPVNWRVDSMGEFLKEVEMDMFRGRDDKTSSPQGVVLAGVQENQ